MHALHAWKYLKKIYLNYNFAVLLPIKLTMILTEKKAISNSNKTFNATMFYFIFSFGMYANANHCACALIKTHS